MVDLASALFFIWAYWGSVNLRFFFRVSRFDSAKIARIWKVGPVQLVQISVPSGGGCDSLSMGASGFQNP